jgi:hypothetical protein
MAEIVNADAAHGSHSPWTDTFSSSLSMINKTNAKKDTIIADSEQEAGLIDHSTHPLAVIPFSNPISVLLRNNGNPSAITKTLNASKQGVSDSAPVTPQLVNKKDVIAGYNRSISTQTTSSYAPIATLLTATKQSGYEYSPMLMLQQKVVTPDRSETRGTPNIVPKGQMLFCHPGTPPIAPLGSQPDNFVESLADNTLTILLSSSCDQSQRPNLDSEVNELCTRNRSLDDHHTRTVKSAAHFIIRSSTPDPPYNPAHDQIICNDTNEQTISTPYHRLYKATPCAAIDDAHTKDLTSAQGLYQGSLQPSENLEPENALHGCNIATAHQLEHASATAGHNCLSARKNHSTISEGFAGKSSPTSFGMYSRALSIVTRESQS